MAFANGFGGRPDSQIVTGDHGGTGIGDNVTTGDGNVTTLYGDGIAAEGAGDRAVFFQAVPGGFSGGAEQATRRVPAAFAPVVAGFADQDVHVTRGHGGERALLAGDTGRTCVDVATGLQAHVALRLNGGADVPH